MGASLTTVSNTLEQQYERLHAAHGRGYLTASQVIALQPQCKLSPCHIAVLWLLDRDHDGCFSKAELLAFAEWVHTYARVHRCQEPAFMVTGYTCMKLWSCLHSSGAQQQAFVDWVMAAFTRDLEVAFTRNGQPLVKNRALKSLHASFDMQRNHNMSYDAFLDMVQRAGEEEQVWPAQRARQSRLVATDALRVFVAALVDGMLTAVPACEAADLQEVVCRAEAAVEQARAARHALQHHSSSTTTTPGQLKRQQQMLLRGQ